MLKHLDMKVVGEGQHRSGWPYCIDSLQPLFNPQSPVLLDDFVERTFMYDTSLNIDNIHSVPWVGMFHHPPDLPAWYMDNLRLQHLERDTRWQKALPNLRLIITFGENLQQWCQQAWPQVPSVVIKHPTGQPLIEWSPDRFLAKTRPCVVQVGWFLRNMLAIYQARIPLHFAKVHLNPPNGWAKQMLWVCKEFYRTNHPERHEFDDVIQLPACNATDFDLMLADSVVLIEVIAAVANNTVVECIARNTPICINRHAGPVAYLGNDYPLFYDHFDDIERILTTENILAAHQYLRQLDKWWIRGVMFREQVQAACLKHVPECFATGMSSTHDETCAI